MNLFSSQGRRLILLLVLIITAGRIQLIDMGRQSITPKAIEPGKKNIIYWTCGSLNIKTFEISGHLSEVRDSSILVVSDYFGSMDLDIKILKTVSVRPQKWGFCGVTIGAAAGAVIGAMIGLAGGNDPPGFLSFSAGEKPAMGAVVGIIPGGLIGLGVASAKVQIPINGSMDSYNQNKINLERYTYRKLLICFIDLFKNVFRSQELWIKNIF